MALEEGVAGGKVPLRWVAEDARPSPGRRLPPTHHSYVPVIVLMFRSLMLGSPTGVGPSCVDSRRLSMYIVAYRRQRRYA